MALSSMDAALAAFAQNRPEEEQPGSQIEAAYRRLREDIIGGVLRASEKLRIEHLRRAYPFGASALREALSRLVSDGLVECEAQRGYWVSPLSREELADITIQSAAEARHLGHEPRVALLSFSNFGNPMREKAERIREAVALLDRRKVDFEDDGEMQANVALDFNLMRTLYPFCRLSGPANVLVMPALHSANISAGLLQQIGGGTVIGPVLIGLAKPAQIVQASATVSDLVNAAALAALDALR